MSKSLMKIWTGFEDTIANIGLVIAVLVVFVNVITRYFFSFSISWAEEIIRYSVVWASMMAASVIIKDNGHVSVSAFIESKYVKKRKHTIEAFNYLVSFLFSCVLAYAGANLVISAYTWKAISETRLMTPLFIPYLVMPLSMGLMSLRWLIKLIENRSSWVKDPLFYVLTTLFILLFYVLISYFNPLVTLCVLFAILLLTGAPISIGMGVAALAALYFFNNVNLTTISSKLFWRLNKLDIFAIPFFILAGNFMAGSSLGKYLIDFTRTIVKRIHGGLGVAIMLAAMIFGAMSGSSIANAATLGVIAIPLLKERGYPVPLTLGIIGAGGTLAIIIPPSSILVLYGSVAGQSIADLFLAGIIPGISLGLVLCIYIYLYCRKNKIDEVGDEPFSFAEVFRAMSKAIWALLMPVIILGSMYGGFTTPTESAVLGSIYAFIAATFIYKELKMKDLWPILRKSMAITGMIFLIIMMSEIFGSVISIERVPLKLAQAIVASNLSPTIFLLVLLGVLFVMGFFVGPAPIIIIMTPILLPIINEFGISPIHLGILITVSMELAFLTPPVGTVLYVLSGIGKVPVEEVARSVIPFVLILLAGAILIAFVPQLSLLLL